MQINVLLFGQLVDEAGSSTITVKDVKDTNELIEQIHTSFPALANMKYAIAVDKQIINENLILHSNNTVALLPPFSGG